MVDLVEVQLVVQLEGQLVVQLEDQFVVQMEGLKLWVSQSQLLAFHQD